MQLLIYVHESIEEVKTLVESILLEHFHQRTCSHNFSEKDLFMHTNMNFQ